MEKFNVVRRSEGNVTLVRRMVDSGSEDPLTEHEVIIDELIRNSKKSSDELMTTLEHDYGYTFPEGHEKEWIKELITDITKIYDTSSEENNIK